MVTTPKTRGPSIPVALTFAVVGGLIAIIATVVVMRNSYPGSVIAVLAAVALAGFGFTAYGLIQAVLAVVDTAGERRMRDREISERRQGDRARKPGDG